MREASDLRAEPYGPMKRILPLPAIGWREWVRFPQLGLPHVKAKVDTGARSSSLHAFNVARFDREGAPWVRFKVHPIQRDATHEVAAEAPLLDERLVRDSGGRQTLRPVIRTEVELLGARWPIELTLTARDEMGFRMLLGREAVRRRFVVDPGRSYLAGRPAAENPPTPDVEDEP